MQGLCITSTLFWAPKKARVRKPLVILSPLFGDLRECWGYIAIPPSFGPPRRQGEVVTSDFVPLVWGPQNCKVYVAFPPSTRAMYMSLCRSLAGRMTLHRQGNNQIMMCMDGTGPELSNCLLICGIGVYFGTFGVVVPTSCINRCVFYYTLPNFASGDRSVTLRMDRGNMFPLMFGRAPKQPLRMTRKMMLGRRLIYVHRAIKSTLR